MYFETVELRLVAAHVALTEAASPLLDPVRTRSDAAHLIGIARARIVQALDILLQAEAAARPTDRPPVCVSA